MKILKSHEFWIGLILGILLIKFLPSILSMGKGSGSSGKGSLGL